MNTARKRCPNCCPSNETWTNIHDRGTSEDGSPVWRCRNCSNELRRHIRRSREQVLCDKNPAYAAEKDAVMIRLLRDMGTSEEDIALFMGGRR